MIQVKRRSGDENRRAEIALESGAGRLQIWLLLASSYAAMGFFPGFAPGRFFRFFSGSEFAAFSRGPPGLVDLAAAGNSQAMCRNVFRDRRTGGNVCAIADTDRSNENRIGRTSSKPI